MTENGPGGSENIYEKTLDITQFAGDTVYIAFRHHDVTDNSSIEIDDVSVTSDANMSVERKKANKLSHFMDANNTLVLNSSTNMSYIRLYSILGQQVTGQNLSSNKAYIDLNGLTSGIYLAQVEIAGQIKSFKIVIR